MTQPRELDHILTAFFVAGTDELADRVIDAALDQIDHTPQRHATRLRRRSQSTTIFTRLAAAAVIGVFAIGGALYLMRPSEPSIGSPTPTPTVTARPTGLAGTPTSRPRASSPPGSMADERQIHTATELLDGRVLVAGGYTLVEVTLASAELYDPTTRAFSEAGLMSDARGLHTATLLANGRVLIVGGGPASWVLGVGPYLASAELYDPKTGTFSPTGSMTTAREDHTATLLLDGRVLITGGNDVADHGVATAELYDPTTGTFSSTGSMTTARGFHTATLLADGRVLIAGGDPAAWMNSGPFLATAELYDPGTGTFSATGTMSDGRTHHAATLLADGRVLITGGINSDAASSLATAEIYDPATGTFSATGPITDGRVYHTATLLLDGRVLIAGGLPDGRDYTQNPQFLASAEIYDPTTGRSTETGPMAEARTYHAATLLADGRVLITGGVGSGATNSLASAEIYDPAMGKFSPAG